MRAWTCAAAALVVTATVAAAQFRPSEPSHSTDLRYDGKFTFLRLRWNSGFAGFSRRGGFNAAWNHDVPRAERHLALIMTELTAVDMHTHGSRVLGLDDPELFDFPIAYMWEPGFWNLTDDEAKAFRTYLLKGGFAVFEDFDGAQQWTHFEAQMRRVLPDGHFVRLDESHAIFDAFFTIKDIEGIVHPMYGLRPSYYGIFEDNDPSNRLMVVANFDNDVPEYWEWSGEGVYPFDASNEAYKLGVNYLIYGLTR